MLRCPTCGTEFADSAPNCPSCSGSEVAMYRCARCGERFGDADACPVCGRARLAFPCDAHPEATAEGRCVVCGRALCRRCRKRGGRAELCAEHGEVTVIQGWAQVYSTTSEFEAQLVRENLQAEGLEARIFSQKDAMLSVDLGELSIVRLLVPAWEYLPARQVIRDHMDVEGEVAFACPACGEAYDAPARECTACGALLA